MKGCSITGRELLRILSSMTAETLSKPVLLEGCDCFGLCCGVDEDDPTYVTLMRLSSYEAREEKHKAEADFEQRKRRYQEEIRRTRRGEV